MKKVLLVSGSEEEAKIISRQLIKTEYIHVKKNQNGNSARRMIYGNEFDLIIINTPLSNEFGKGLAMDAAERSVSEIILITESDISEELFDKLCCFNIFVISKPLNYILFSQTLKHIAVSHISELNNFTFFKKKTEEIKIIIRAKKYLMRFLNLTEPEAHRFIEKKSYGYPSNQN